MTPFITNLVIYLILQYQFFILSTKFSKRKLYVNKILRQLWNSHQSTDSRTFDHVIRWRIKSGILQLSRRLQSLNNVVIHIRMKHYHSYKLPLPTLPLHHVITSQTSWNAYQNKRVPLLHFTWPSYAKVIKATVPKLSLMKGRDSYGTHDLWLCYPDKWRASDHNFYKSFKALNLKDKNNAIARICSLG